MSFNSSGIHGLSEAIEFHMGVDPSVRRQKFFEVMSIWLYNTPPLNPISSPSPP